jgi:opacity protein-like surface antigen
VALRLDLEYISRDITREDKDDIGTVTMMPLMINTQVRFANLGRVTPYLGFGLSISFNSLKKGKRADEWEEYYEAKYPGYKFDADFSVEHSFAFKVPIGIDIFVTNNVALNIEAKYFYTNPEGEEITEAFDGLVSDTDTDEVDQSTFAFGAGASFSF